jgi:cytochrome c oxidase subunit 2
MERLIPQASSYAADIDGLIILITVLAGAWLLLAEGFLLWLVWRFRARDGVRTQYLDGTEPHIKKWLSRPHTIILVLDIVVIVAAVRVWVNVKQTLPPADATIRVVAQQWGWVFQHPGADHQLDSADDIYTTDDLYVENDKTYHFQLQSRDVLHSFSVPVFRIKQDAVPGRTITGWFKPIRTGNFDIQCVEICGVGHGVMGARIHVQDAAEHAAWVAGTSPTVTQ